MDRPPSIRMNEKAVKSFADIDIGDEIGPVARTPTREMVQQYMAATGMIDRRFLDANRAQEKGFLRPTVPGPLNAALLAQMLLDHFPGWRLRALYTTFRAPVPHGEAVTYWGTVTEKSEREGVATIHCDIVVENEQGERTIVGTATLQERRPYHD